jgi:thymidylate kinase
MKQMDALYDIGVTRRLCAEDAMPTGLLEVLNAFHRQQVSYCYWKSSRRLHAGFGGRADVDLLVARNDQHRVQLILLERDFKLFPSVADRDHPATLSFLCYDVRGGQLIHLHLHFQLIVGERLLKNYRIPWEEVLLTGAILHPTLPIRILEPTSEAVLLVVRACLELRRLDLMTLWAWQATTRKFALDRAEIAARVDRTKLRELAAELLNEDLAELVADAFYGEQPLETQSRLRRRMRKHCAAYRSYNAVEARVRSAGRALLWVAGGLNKHVLHAPRPWNRRAPGGGCMVAMIGVDGSGKSTLVATMRAWLGSKVDVVPIYLGTGDGRPSLWLRPFKLAVPLIMRVLKSKPKGASQGKISGHAPGPLYKILLMVWAVAVALDKRKKLAAARRGTNRGLIVLADRYPQNQIRGFNDGPLLTRLNVVPHWLRRFERAAYDLADRLPPDLVIKLVVTPDTAARREPEMDPAIIRERIAALQRLEFPGARVVCVDAEQPLAEVIRAVKYEIWRLI